jgi:hypothetical protein
MENEPHVLLGSLNSKSRLATLEVIAKARGADTPTIARLLNLPDYENDDSKEIQVLRRDLAALLRAGWLCRTRMAGGVNFYEVEAKAMIAFDRVSAEIESWA